MPVRASMLLILSPTVRTSSARLCQYLGLFQRRLYGIRQIMTSACPSIIDLGQ